VNNNNTIINSKYQNRTFSLNPINIRKSIINSLNYSFLPFETLSIYAQITKNNNLFTWPPRVKEHDHQRRYKKPTVKTFNNTTQENTKMPRYIKQTNPRNSKQYQRKALSGITDTINIWHPSTIPIETVISRILVYSKHKCTGINPDNIIFKESRTVKNKGIAPDGTQIKVDNREVIIEADKILIDELRKTHNLRITKNNSKLENFTYDEIVPISHQLPTGSFTLQHLVHSTITSSIIRQGLNNLGIHPRQILYWPKDDTITKIYITFETQQNLIEAINIMSSNPTIRGYSTTELVDVAKLNESLKKKNLINSPSTPTESNTNQQTTDNNSNNTPTETGNTNTPTEVNEADANRMDEDQ
jgi:hypothetical protein